MSQQMCILDLVEDLICCTSMDVMRAQHVPNVHRELEVAGADLRHSNDCLRDGGQKKPQSHAITLTIERIAHDRFRLPAFSICS